MGKDFLIDWHEPKSDRYSTSQITVHQRSFLATVNKFGGLGSSPTTFGRVDAFLSGQEDSSIGLGYFV